MDLISALRIAMRRWKITAAVLLVTVIAASSAYIAAGTVYSAENYVVIVPGSVTSIPQSGDAQVQQAVVDQSQRAALQSAGGAQLVTKLLATNLETPEIRARFGGGSASYSISNEGQLPVLTVTASGSDPNDVRSLLQRVVEGSDGVLADLQRTASLPPAATYRAPRFAPDPVVTASNPSRTKVVAAIGIAGILLAVLLAVAIDGPLTRRESARAQANDGDGEGPAEAGSSSSPTNGAAASAPLPPRSSNRADLPSSSYPGVPQHSRVGNDAVDSTERLQSTMPRSPRPGR